MSSQPAALPLPKVPGPKLGPFTPDAKAEINFIEDLGNSDDSDAKVWKVEINGTVYTLKMFHFCSLNYLKNTLAVELRGELSSSQAYVDYYDPFNCECRAYGRLAQAKRRDPAVQAHGYLLLSQQQERKVSSMIEEDLNYETDEELKLTLDGQRLWDRWEEHREKPIRAIVKEFVEDDDFEEAFKTGRISAETLWKNLEDLHDLGIMVKDFHMRNYIGGRLVDFSRAWTMYHPGLDLKRILKDDLERLRRVDTHGLLVMLQDWYFETLVVDELIIPDDFQECDAGRNKNAKDPLKYDWRQWESDRKVAEAYVKKLFVQDARASK